MPRRTGSPSSDGGERVCAAGVESRAATREVRPRAHPNRIVTPEVHRARGTSFRSLLDPHLGTKAESALVARGARGRALRTAHEKPAEQAGCIGADDLASIDLAFG